MGTKTPSCFASRDVNCLNNAARPGSSGLGADGGIKPVKTFEDVFGTESTRGLIFGLLPLLVILGGFARTNAAPFLNTTSVPPVFATNTSKVVPLTPI